MCSILRLNHFYPVISYRRIQKKKKATSCSYTVRPLVMVRATSCQRKGLEEEQRVNQMFLSY